MRGEKKLQQQQQQKKTRAEHHLIPTGYGKASNKSSPTGGQIIRGGGEVEGLRLTVINEQFIQSAL